MKTSVRITIGIAAVTIIAAAGVVSGFTPEPLSSVIGKIKEHTFGEVPTVVQDTANVLPMTREQIAASQKRFDAMQLRMGIERPSVRDILRAIDVSPGDAVHMRQSGRVDAHVAVDPTLADMSICGEKYVSRKILIDGVDVVQRISELAASGVAAEKNLQSGQDPKGTATILCWNITHNQPSRETYGDYRIAELPVSDVVAEPWDKERKATAYYVGIGIVRFVINSSTYDVYEQDGYDGTLRLLGNLKK